MKRSPSWTLKTFVMGVLVVGLGLIALAVGPWNVDTGRESELGSMPPPATTPELDEPVEGALYGRVTTADGTVYEGRLRWGGAEEAFWGDYFNGFKDPNPWLAYAPPEAQTERSSFSLFGIEIAERQREIDLRRPFVARFGDITRIEAVDRELRVTLKSGTVFLLDRFAADDLADGLRIWDADQGVVDLHERHIRMVEHLPDERSGAVAARLHGTVHTAQGPFTGFIQWNREQCMDADMLTGFHDGEELSLRFDSIRRVARKSVSRSVVTLHERRELELSGTREVGADHRGVYVFDPRFGRVSVSWETLDHVEFSEGRPSPAYGDFPAGRPIMGSVTTQAGQTLSGRLVYDLDEAETTDTLDMRDRGVAYSIPFGLIARITPPGREKDGPKPGRVALLNGEELLLEAEGDLGRDHAGMLIFGEGREPTEFVPWIEVDRIELDPADGRQWERSGAVTGPTQTEGPVHTDSADLQL